MLLDLRTYTSHYAPLRSRAILRLVFPGGGHIEHVCLLFLNCGLLISQVIDFSGHCQVSKGAYPRW